MNKSFFFPLAIGVGLTAALIQPANTQNTSPYWSMAGNSTATTSSKLGTTNTIPLRLYTNNAIRLHINGSGGNIGIGTTSPAQKLDVNGNVNLANGYGLYMENHRVLGVDSISRNVSIGNGARLRTTGRSNTATGYFALSGNNSAIDNTATGAFSLYLNTTGNGNNATGTEVGYDFSGVDPANNEKSLYALRYSEFVVPLVKAVQELSERSEALSEENEELKRRIEKLEVHRNKCETTETTIWQQKSRFSGEALLQQNIPNPANSSTRISYTIPANSRAQSRFSDNTGKTLQQAPLTESGVFELTTAGLPSGIYNYSLIINDNVVATKQITIAR